MLVVGHFFSFACFGAFLEPLNLESDVKIKNPPARALAAGDHDLGKRASSRSAAPRQWTHTDNRDTCCGLWFALELSQEKYTCVPIVEQAVSPLRRLVAYAGIRNGFAT
jgi:hypothetical protein